MKKAEDRLKSINFSPSTSRTLADILLYRGKNYSAGERSELLSTFKEVMDLGATMPDLL